VVIEGTRRTQTDRSTGTRSALAEAAIDLLVERGWAAVTAVEVCQRAGVSRGAFHHHYPTLAALLADALQHLYDDLADFDRPHPRDLAELIDRTWDSLREPRFKAVLEAWQAMSNDPSLRAEIGPVVARFSQLVGADEVVAKQIVAKADLATYFMAREALLGLAIGRATSGGRPLPHERAVLRRIKELT